MNILIGGWGVIEGEGGGRGGVDGCFWKGKGKGVGIVVWGLVDRIGYGEFGFLMLRHREKKEKGRF